MMKSIQRLLKLFPCLLFIVFVTCSKDDPAVQQPSNPSLKTCVLKSGTSNGTSITFDRDDKHWPITIRYSNGNKPAITCSIQYDADHRVVKLIQGNAYVEYSYQSGKPVTSTVFTRKSPDASFEQYWQYYYHYDDQGRLDSTTDHIGQYERFEYDAAGNVIKRYTKQRGQPEKLTRQYLTFDDKKNPRVEANFDQVGVLLDWIEGNFITMLQLPTLSQHNSTKDVYVSSDRVILRTCSFQYNPEGYPISARIQTDAKSDVTTEVIAYDCW
ncbi:YD repeat-containing protein [Chryseolinea serpens]|uniref:YD repeat-containing protein n=1 Tax=Chryseolinea serpens TaxID=947013 RepID=A0A1M5K5C2_9BACT|nr:YD repeat-containing protein [Chryseolinea serpens]